ncbi:BQ5605_C027g10413 [Microbotryum silenes-dioicae]|uniref:Peroxin-7 n=1 Tax=Microbotryum silenes-dioicae TaxID=796604 RepID=A0A2X0PNI3_9BASI|nr:BQ5605_C027g10413 [Microbotryum silenes-dioicae]
MQKVPPTSVRRCRTDGFAAYAVKFSPFFPHRLAVAGSANFGLVGNGRLSVLNTGGAGMGGPVGAHRAGGGGMAMGMGIEKGFDTQDGLYDLAWSEMHENQIVTASGDGSVKLWDVALDEFPIRKWHEHAREVFSVDWNNLQKDLFCTSSWDCTVKIWTPDRPTSIATIPAHTACVYAAAFAPHQPTTLASCSTDGHLKVWDTRSPMAATPSTVPGQPSTAQAQIAIPAHSTEVLSLDWNKYQPHRIATGSVDRTIRIHDLRMAGHDQRLPPSNVPVRQPTSTVATLLGHEYAVRRVAWSPHSPNVLGSTSYDMTARIWTIDAANLGAGGANTSSFGSAGMGGGGRLMRIYDGHTEFVVGQSWSLFEEGLVATCSWDQEVHLWNA